MQVRNESLSKANEANLYCVKYDHGLSREEDMCSDTQMSLDKTAIKDNMSAPTVEKNIN